MRPTRSSPAIRARTGAALEERFGIADGAEQSAMPPQGADLVFLTVKPQVLVGGHAAARVVAERRAGGGFDVAGASIETLEQRSLPRCDRPGHAEHARPDRRGMMVWTSTADCERRSARQVQTALGALGAGTLGRGGKICRHGDGALSGTGPTYVFLMMEALIDAGVHMGFPRRIAEQIVLQTVSDRWSLRARRASIWRSCAIW